MSHANAALTPRARLKVARLVVDQGEPENLLAYCGDRMRRIGPSRWEFRRRNWRPDRDLDLLIVTPEPYIGHLGLDGVAEWFYEWVRRRGGKLEW